MYRLGNVVMVIGKGCICTIVNFGKWNRLLECVMVGFSSYNTCKLELISLKCIIPTLRAMIIIFSKHGDMIALL
jgi:hypothetical protein